MNIHNFSFIFKCFLKPWHSRNPVTIEEPRTTCTKT